ncbi:Het-C-domain-containing protein [Artomyces pyxidatus]|uniref:Het-C-domain-containing protein n=1 Tax=Artomyces pyxidatus TaxID=48021 RepID=A0ACB8THZ1_9AGAM|nr:Het-C-domain-containing protein [Artomyces pyxidatus]
MHSLTATLLILTVFVIFPARVKAFGAGDIPDFSYLNNKAFRHGDIENILTEVAKTVGKGASAAGFLSFAQSILNSGAGGTKFNKGDVKKVYFGNWLRDYSQAMDIGGLSKLSADTLVLIVAVLGFMTFGFATEEFEVTANRLGVYLPVEHIDNPKGYGAKEGDPRQFHPRLRPPVNPRELEIDERTGMKNYIATENRGWDTSTAHIRRVFRACIDYGRRSRGREDADLFEAYRLLGTGLHTLEDLLAHSNWCEISLRKMGHEQVFCHVGDRVIINTPNGPAPPLITGTFGGADFLHSLMGEATDHLSQASVTDLTNKMNEAANSDQDSNIMKLKALLSKLPFGGDSSQMDQAESLHAQSQAYHFNPNNVAPPEVQRQLWALLKWRDGVFRAVLEKIEMIPGLTDLIDGITDALNAYVYTVLAPWLTPILQQVTGVLGEGSKAVIDSEDQYEVFDNPHASDPSHSLLSKDHFGLILNEPAGKIAQVVVQYATRLIVNAWFDNADPDQVITQILEAFHHPYYNVGRSQIQNAMFEAMERWFSELGEEQETIMQCLTKESVRAGKNKRPGSEDETAETPGGYHSQKKAAYEAAGQFTAAEDYLSSEAGVGYREEREKEHNYVQGYGEPQAYERNTGSWEGRTSGQVPQQPSYGYGRSEEPSTGYQYEARRQEDEPSYGRQQSYGTEERSSYGRDRYSNVQTTPSTDYQSGYQPSYAAPAREQQSSYGRQQEYGGGQGYGRPAENYGEERAYTGRNEESEYSETRGGYGGSRQEYGGSGGYGEPDRAYGGAPGRYAAPREREEVYEEPAREYGSGYGERNYERLVEEESQDERGYGGNEESEETFGAERLNIGGGYGEGEGYGRNEYGRSNEEAEY